jgi:hypothetical protein
MAKKPASKASRKTSAKDGAATRRRRRASPPGLTESDPSGFAVAPNALASLIVPHQIPAILVVSERGVFGEFNIGQHTVSKLLRPTLDTLGIVSRSSICSECSKAA